MTVTFDKNLCQKSVYQLLTSIVGPRPIALLSTLSQDGIANLAPFSFFNMVSINPPILMFSPLRKMRDNTTKDTYKNCMDRPECVVHVVTYDRIQQISICGNEYGEEVDEFEKAGFTKQRGIVVKPYMVKEIPVKFECEVIDMKQFGDSAGAGIVCFAKILVAHIDDAVFDHQHAIDSSRLNLVGRIGGDWYTKLTNDSMFRMPKTGRKLSMGFDSLPKDILNSTVLTANHLGMLASLEAIPDFDPEFDYMGLRFLMESPPSVIRTQHLHTMAARMLSLDVVDHAWQVLLRNNYSNLDRDQDLEIFEIKKSSPEPDEK